MTAAKPWLKLWTEIRTDPKIRRAPASFRWAWVALLCLAREINDDDSNGRLEMMGEPMGDDELADAVGLPVHEWRQVRSYLLRMEMVTEDGDTLVIVNFAKRQEAADTTNAKRQAKHRSKAKSQPAAPPVAASNALRNGESNALRNTPSNAQEDRGQRTEDRGQRFPESSTESEPTQPPDPVGLPLFLSVIGFEDPEGFLENVNQTLLAQWAFYYSTLNEVQRRAVGNWPALINHSCRNNKPPRLDGHQKAAFYRDYMQ